LLTALVTAVDAEPIPFDEMSKSMRRACEQQDDMIATRFTLPAKGNSMSKKIKEHVQPVDTLAKMARRYSSPADMAYRRSLALLIYLATFGDAAEKGKMVDLLVLQLGPEDPQILAIADQLKTSNS
jgi:hypothetical protein